MRSLITILFLVILQHCFGQSDSSILKLRILPGKSSIKVDGKIQPTKPIYKFKGDGQHRLTIWSFGYDLYDTTLNLKRGDTLLLRKSLLMLPEYRQYFADKKRYDHQMLLWKGVVRTASIASLLYAGSRIFVARSNYTRAMELKDQYTISTNSKEIVELKSEYDERYKKIENCRITGPITFAFGLGTAYLSYKKIKEWKSKKPVYNDPNKLRFESISLHPTRLKDNHYASITLNFGL